MHTTVLIPNQIKTKNPKPTKTQIIEALMVRARLLHIKREEAKELKREKLVDELEAHCKTALATTKPQHFEFSHNVSCWGNHVNEPTLTLKVKSRKTDSLQRKISNLNREHFNEDKIKKMIKAGMVAPNPLLTDESANAALDNLLATMVGPQQATCIEV